jgi:hypothetical protein
VSAAAVLSPMSTRPHTGLSVPECCCRACHLDQLRRYVPPALRPKARPRLDLGPPIVQIGRYAAAHGISTAELRRRAQTVEVPL